MENKVKKKVPKLTGDRILFRQPISGDGVTRGWNEKLRDKTQEVE